METPAFFPVLDFIGGTTVKSGGIWSRVRNRLFGSPKFNGAMYQALSFLNFGLTPDNLDDWREHTLREHFTNHDPPKDWHPQPESFTEPLFIDSGGYRLMQSDTFQVGRGEDVSNDWGIGTTPESVLELQRDFGADIIATLDFPIPEDLRDSEKDERLERSIQSALDTIELLNEDHGDVNTKGWDPTVYVAIHGHNYEEIDWYIGEVLNRVSDPSLIDGFAIGSLVPLRSNIATLVDIVQGAVNAIPEEYRDQFGLHVFGVSGKLFGLMSLLGVDSFDSTTYVQTARNRNFIDPDSWKQTSFVDVSSDSWTCNCEACAELDIDAMRTVMQSDTSYQSIAETKYLKSDFYALMAHHNFLVYEREVEKVRHAIKEGSLLSHVIKLSENNADLRKGLQRAQMRDPELRDDIPKVAFSVDVDPEPLIRDQDSEEPVENSMGTTSLKHTPDDYNVLDRSHEPDAAPVLLVIPCSQTKPYSESKSHQVVESGLDELDDGVYSKLTVSGLYGPVPESDEHLDPITQYDYALNSVDDEQRELVISRLTSYLQEYGNRYDKVIGYVTSKQYRIVFEEAFTNAGVGIILPSNPQRLQLWEMYRDENIGELQDTIEEALCEPTNK
ncbi:tRNA-guanine transglycosylase [Halarchaeum grantii]|uniref:tRNA-guanine transglycosylase n=1 Tax=Halarchaeum grantii TaxID=1193105 RepID=UPI00166D7CCB|nr:tRNA-guanine transglycosylase [Halarchaeum grantii]